MDTPPHRVTCALVNPRERWYLYAMCRVLIASCGELRKPPAYDRRCGENRLPNNRSSPAVKSLAPSVLDRHRICPTAIRWPIFNHPPVLLIIPDSRWQLLIFAIRRLLFTPPLLPDSSHQQSPPLISAIQWLRFIPSLLILPPWNLNSVNYLELLTALCCLRKEKVMICYPVPTW